MSEELELKRRRGAVTVLALFVSLLFGSAPTVAQAAPQDARFGAPELVKRGPVLRSAVRTAADDNDADPVLLSAPPTVVTEILARRDAAAGLGPRPAAAIRPRVAAYRARAPPAV